jgi:hypothetical protein
MATNGNGTRRDGNGSPRKPAVILAVEPKRLTSAADHATAAEQHSKLAAHHAGLAATRAKAEAKRR